MKPGASSNEPNGHRTAMLRRLPSFQDRGASSNEPNGHRTSTGIGRRVRFPRIVSAPAHGVEGHSLRRHQHGVMGARATLE